jgi:hypothetical protein
MIQKKNKSMSISRYGVFLSVFLISAGGVVAVAGGAPPVAPSGPAHDRPAPPLPGTRIEAELAYIKTALNLTDQQMPVWGPVADALRAQAKHVDAEIEAHRAAFDKMRTQDDAAPGVDLIARLEERQRSVAVQADDLAKLLNVLRPFYAALTTEQKENVEDLLPVGGPHERPPFGQPPFGPPPFESRAPGMGEPPPFPHEFH